MGATNSYCNDRVRCPASKCHYHASRRWINMVLAQQNENPQHRVVTKQIKALPTPLNVQPCATSCLGNTKPLA